LCGLIKAKANEISLNIGPINDSKW